MQIPVLSILDIRPRLPNRKTWEGYEIHFKGTNEKHPGRNHPGLIRRLLTAAGGGREDPGYFTAGWETVFDPMCGIGTVLREALRLGATMATGFDIWPEALKLARKNLAWYRNTSQFGAAVKRDSSTYRFSDSWVDVIITSPPFPNGHSPGKSDLQDRMREKRGMGAGHGWSGLLQDICCKKKGEDLWQAHIEGLLGVWACCLSALKPGHVAFVITRDHVLKNKLVPYTAIVAASLKEAGFKTVGMYRRPLDPSGYHQRRIKHFADKGLGKPLVIEYEDVLVARNPDR